MGKKKGQNKAPKATLDWVRFSKDHSDEESNPSTNDRNLNRFSPADELEEAKRLSLAQYDEENEDEWQNSYVTSRSKGAKNIF